MFSLFVYINLGFVYMFSFDAYLCPFVLSRSFKISISQAIYPMLPCLNSEKAHAYRPVQIRSLLPSLRLSFVYLPIFQIMSRMRFIHNIHWKYTYSFYMTLSLPRRVILLQPIIQTWQTVQHILHVCTYYIHSTEHRITRLRLVAHLFFNRAFTNNKTQRQRPKKKTTQQNERNSRSNFCRFSVRISSGFRVFYLRRLFDSVRACGRPSFFFFFVTSFNLGHKLEMDRRLFFFCYVCCSLLLLNGPISIMKYDFCNTNRRTHNDYHTVGMYLNGNKQM